MIGNRIKFRHLHTFVEVARQKSVVKASEILNISQPAVTKTMRELEEILGVPVLERDGRGIRITRYGEVFLRHAGTALTALRQGLDSVSQELDGSGPPIRIGALPTVSTRIMPKAISLFLAEKTGSKVKIVTGENAVLLEQPRVGDLDLVVGRLAAPEKMTGFPSSISIRSGCGFWCGQGTPFWMTIPYSTIWPIIRCSCPPVIRSFARLWSAC
ncbi:hypothetical protein C061_03202 [Brucella melitensis F5/07-239A]|nr:hypothetical protein C061_03202 [Brucella melitensis F5/07-239A]